MIEVYETEVLDGHSSWVITINGHPVASIMCEHWAHKVCQRLAECRNTGHREAMRVLTQDFGMCEEFAESLYSHLFGPTQGGVQ